MTQQTLNNSRSYNTVTRISFAVHCQKDGRWELPKKCHPEWESNPGPPAQYTNVLPMRGKTNLGGLALKHLRPHPHTPLLGSCRDSISFFLFSIYSFPIFFLILYRSFDSWHWKQENPGRRYFMGAWVRPKGISRFWL